MTICGNCIKEHGYDHDKVSQVHVVATDPIDGGDFCENTWFAIDRADDFKAWLLEEFRENLREGLERHESWKKENGE